MAHPWQLSRGNLRRKQKRKQIFLEGHRARFSCVPRWDRQRPPRRRTRQKSQRRVYVEGRLAPNNAHQTTYNPHSVPRAPIFVCRISEKGREGKGKARRTDSFPAARHASMSSSAVLMRRVHSAAAAARSRAAGARAPLEAVRAWREQEGGASAAAPARGGRPSAAAAASPAAGARRGLCSAAPVAADEKDETKVSPAISLPTRLCLRSREKTSNRYPQRCYPRWVRAGAP